MTKSREKRLLGPGTFGWFCGGCGSRQVVSVTTRVQQDDAKCQRCGQPAGVWLGAPPSSARPGGAQRLGKITSSVSVPTHEEGGSDGK